MTRLVVIMFAGLFLATSPVFPWSGKCVWVMTGDSIVVTHDGELVKIGFHGIACPKWGQRFALEAARFTANMVRNRTVEVRPISWHPSRVTYAAVSVDGKSVNEALVKAGLAWWQEHYAPNDLALAEAHVQAMKRKVGIWSSSDPVPPWKYEKEMKDMSVEPPEPEPYDPLEREYP